MPVSMRGSPSRLYRMRANANDQEISMHTRTHTTARTRTRVHTHVRAHTHTHTHTHTPTHTHTEHCAHALYSWMGVSPLCFDLMVIVVADVPPIQTVPPQIHTHYSQPARLFDACGAVQSITQFSLNKVGYIFLLADRVYNGMSPHRTACITSCMLHTC